MPFQSALCVGSSLKMRRKKDDKILNYLGLPSLLQLQKSGIDVSAQLRKAGKSELVRFVPIKEMPEALAILPAKRTNKYHVCAVDQRTADGIVFSSGREKQAYELLMEKGIRFTRQNRYVLQEAFVDVTGKKQREIAYVDDFCLTGRNGEDLVMDVKGIRTPIFRLKQKLFLHKFKKEIHCVSKINHLFRFLIDNGLVGHASVNSESTA